MAEHSYRAYISYSHSDETWGAWLQRALELYRVPRKLVGKETSAGHVPARIRPVFRDREDLSSATDLKVTVKHALANSENMIVICSPEAVASRWVNEEIREFAALGRADRIFCIIVDGEPVDDGSLSTCFPAALAEIGHHEPLAADVRKWADGKRVAKLKVIAGLLGLRLDELRQRDLQRRRKRQAIMALGFVAVLTMAVMTVVSQISERHEREKAEQLATFVVDLGERLKTDTDLETLALISTEASRHLQGMDLDKLSPETGKKVALAVRQMAQISQLQGKSDDALEAFQRSRDLFLQLHQKYPGLADLHFELGNAEFYLGNLYFRQGQYEIALASMQEYHRLTQLLVNSDPDNPDWIMELAFSHNNLAALHLERGMGVTPEILTNIAEATRLMEKAMVLKPDDKGVGDSYATILEWAADAQLQACNLDEALVLRNKAKDITYSATQSDPADNDLKIGYAYAVSGVASLQIRTGKLDSAEQNLEQTIYMLQQLSISDPSNVMYSEEVLFRRVLLAKLLSNSGRLEKARSMLDELEPKFELNPEFTNQAAAIRNEYIDFLLAYSDNELQLGNREAANRRLQMVIQLQSEKSESQAMDMFDTLRLVKVRYQWWRINGKDNFTQFAEIPEFDPITDSEFRSCIEAESSARVSIIKGDREQAVNEVAYLRARGYADPEFMRFCEQQGLCGG